MPLRFPRRRLAIAEPGADRPPPRPKGRSTLVTAALLWLGLIAAICLLAGWLAPYEYRTQNLLKRLMPPVMAGGDWTYILGTDQLGRDTLSRLLYGIRFSIIIALGGTVIGAVLGTVLGFIAAHFRGWLEEAIMMLADVQASLPYLIIALAAIAIFGSEVWIFVLIMGFYGWETFARLARGMVLAAKTQGYATAVVAIGGTPGYVYYRHIFPNILSVLVVQFTLNFPQVILLESSLSFLGLGIRPPLTSLGQMLGDGRAFLINAPWMAILPGAIIFLTTMSISTLGDRLRDRLDATLQGT
jgi:peptide/nickel transport system permease protein